MNPNSKVYAAAQKRQLMQQRKLLSKLCRDLTQYSNRPKLDQKRITQILSDITSILGKIGTMES